MDSQINVKAELEKYLAREGVSRAYFLEEGRTHGTEAIRFGLFSQNDKPHQHVRVERKSVGGMTVLDLEISSESWTLFWFFSDLFEELTQPKSGAFSLEEFARFLEGRGFERREKGAEETKANEEGVKAIPFEG